MTTGLQTAGLAVEVYDPLLLDTTWLYSLASEVDGYNHKISALGGFDTAKIDLNSSMISLEDWMERGLGRHVSVISTTSERPAWEGFVDSIDIDLGNFSLTIGPLSDIANRVSCVYDALNTASNPPTHQGSTVTAITENIDSQGRYGIWEKVLSIGSATLAEAGYAQATYLSENAYPARTEKIQTKGSRAVGVTLNCKGYYYWTDGYVYTQTSTSGTSGASTLIQAILTANPNTGIFSSDYTRIDTNAMLAPAYTDDKDFASGFLKYLTALGDVSGNRWTFGCYENRRFVYTQAPTSLYYKQNLKSPDMNVYTIGGALVRPWDIRPAQWLFVSDFLIGKSFGANLNTDLRNIFIEQVEYTAPYDVVITGGKLTQLGQVLAQLSAGGLF